MSSQRFNPGDVKSMWRAPYAIEPERTPANGAMLEGDFRAIKLRPGLMFHCANARELNDVTVSGVQEPCLTVHVFLQGQVWAKLGNMDVQDHDVGEGPQAVITSNTEPEWFERRLCPGMHMRKVHVSIAKEWIGDTGESLFDQDPETSAFLSRPLSRRSFHPSRALIALAEQILHPPHYHGLLHNLYVESRTLGILSEGFAAITEGASKAFDARLSAVDQRRLKMAEELIAAGTEHDLTLASLASEIGTSVSTLQRLFRLVHGTTVFGFARRCALERARSALEEQGVTIAQAAYLAGYTSTANFSTAFKRCFGISPSEIQRR